MLAICLKLAEFAQLLSLQLQFEFLAAFEFRFLDLPHAVVLPLRLIVIELRVLLEFVLILEDMVDSNIFY